MSNMQKKREILLTYTNGMVLPPKDLLDLTGQEKLILTQITPEKAIKK